jgi:hypothetical protein
MTEQELIYKRIMVKLDLNILIQKKRNLMERILKIDQRIAQKKKLIEKLNS